VDELPDVSFYVLTEPSLSEPEPNDIGIWQELANLRTENQAWRDCMDGILADVRTRHTAAPDLLKEAIRKHVATLGQRLARIHNQ
jgi:hypothetical protein